MSAGMVYSLSGQNIDAWANEAAHDPVLFNNDRVRQLISIIPSEHYSVVGTILRYSDPYSIVFTFRKTITPAGERFLERYGSTNREFVGRWPMLPINLEPLSDYLLFISRGEQPCDYPNAWALYRSQVITPPVPTVFTFRYDFSGTA